jgi:energy-coupling factor transporter ATP-binding protein EcfA2
MTAPKEVTLILESIKFVEYEGSANSWALKAATFGNANLLVGRNASGKSRSLNVIHGLAKLLNGQVPKVFQSGNYHTKFYSNVSDGEPDQYLYTLEISKSKIAKEVFKVNGETLLSRTGEKGRIWLAGLKKMVSFNAPDDQPAVRLRRDSIQHPFFEPIHRWAESLRFYQFGTPLGRDRLMMVATPGDLAKDPEAVRDEFEVARLYGRAFHKFGDKFDNAILRDLKQLGYPCSRIELSPIDIPQVQGGLFLALSLKEDDLPGPTSQALMSQGMFRALALVIHLNYCIFSKIHRLVLIDDIGEGLDFSRAQSFIQLILAAAEKHKFQLIMTTNDRFVMNGVPVEHWGVIQRSGNTVEVRNKRNSKKVFDEFDDLGLNNFDFFAKDLYLPSSKS